MAENEQQRPLGGIALTVTEQLYGHLFFPRDRVITANGNVQEFLEPNPNRLGFTIANLGAGAVYVAFELPLALGNGLPIGADGGVMTSSFRDDGNTTGFRLYGIGPNGQTVRVLEIIGLQ